MLRKLIGFLKSRYFITVLLFLVVAALIWFIGPKLGLDEWHPLASMLVRICVIVWLLCFAICIMAKWTLVPLLLVTAFLLTWFISPLLSFGEWRPFASVSARIILIGAFVFVALIYGTYKLLKALQKDPKLINKFFKGNTHKQQEDVALTDASAFINKKISWVLSLLQNSTLKEKALFRIFKKDQYRYTLPWFLSIGSPKSGKTTALLNSGIQLSEPAQVRESAAYLSIHEPPPSTKGCDIWLSHQAVFVDTSGAYLDAQNPNRAILWQALLRGLKNQRPSTPINGTLIHVSVPELLNNTEAENLTLAANIREQILAVKKNLGVTFPVYLNITKTDQLLGFKEYFQSLTEEARQHPLGFSLPLAQEFNSAKYNATQDLSIEKIQEEMAVLHHELEKNLPTRLNEEHNPSDKQALYAFPEEFESLGQRVTHLINTIFIESDFGVPELNQTLRGVFFVSAMQDQAQLTAKQSTILKRYETLTGSSTSTATALARLGNKSFFSTDLFRKMIVPEGQLVKPNREWQAKNSLLRFLAQSLVIVVFAWFAYSFSHSYAENKDYLIVIQTKTGELETKVDHLYQNYDQNNVPDLLDASVTLPSVPGWDINSPLLERRYGLYTPTAIIAASDYTYTKLTDNLLLSQLVSRMESVMQNAITSRDASTAADALNVYLMLHETDPQRYQYKLIKDWVSQDWLAHSHEYNFGGKASVFEHLNNLFVADRIVQSPFVKNEALIQDVRQLLDTQSSSTRIYNRTKNIISLNAPKDFTLVSVLGAEAAVAFRFRNGQSIDHGVSGIYTYDGYHSAFKPRLKATIAEAMLNDVWLMGREGNGSAPPVVSSDMTDDILKQYLSDYAATWTAFLNNIDAQTGDNLEYDMNVLKIFASADSPISKLSRAVVKETTLTTVANDGLLDKVAEQAEKTSRVSSNVKEAGKLASSTAKNALSQQDLLEKTVVDDQFNELRQFVGGQPSTTTAAAPPANNGNGNAVGNSINSLNGYNAMVNALYLYTSVAYTTIETGGIPEANVLEKKAVFEAERLPDPFRRTLATLAASSGAKIKTAKSQVLQKQAQLQLNELLETYNSKVRQVCQNNFAGQYPFNRHSSYETAVSDFALFFGKDGTADQFFNQFLVNYVDTNSSPWRYKSLEAIQVQKALAQAQQSNNAPNTVTTDEPTLEGEYLKLLIAKGPNPGFFSSVHSIQQAYFQDGGQRFVVKYNYDIVEVDPMITELILNFDGNVQRYVHNPFKPQDLTWPSAQSSGSEIEIVATPRIRFDTSVVKHEGPWALFKFLDRAKVLRSTDSGRFLVELMFENRKVLLSITSPHAQNPFNLTTINQFKCD